MFLVPLFPLNKDCDETSLRADKAAGMVSMDFFQFDYVNSEKYREYLSQVTEAEIKALMV